jgi:hypothetical protein
VPRARLRPIKLNALPSPRLKERAPSLVRWWYRLPWKLVVRVLYATFAGATAALLFAGCVIAARMFSLSSWSSDVVLCCVVGLLLYALLVQRDS